MNDLEFIQGCIKGDKQSWVEFLSRYSHLIYKYIYSVLASNNCNFSLDQVQDIYQEIFQSLIQDNYKKLATYRGINGCSLASWLRRVTINSTIDYLRKIKPNISIDLENEDGFTLKDLLVDTKPEVREFLNNENKLKTLYECIQLLDLGEQYFVELYLVQALSLEQIRAHFELERGAIDMRKSRIMQKLENCFKRKGFGLDFRK